jgi:divalent metal cation (Fe/Co/Zn/Cd) transporter
MSQPSPSTSSSPALHSVAARRAIRLEQVTIGYNVVEGIVAVTFGLVAGSIALTGFGFDSFIEVAAAAVVLAQLRADVRGGHVDAVKQARALRFVAVTFFLLAAYVTVEGARDLLGDATLEASPAGIAVTGLSVLVMPTLARFKRRVGERLGSRLVVADAAETRLCAWLSASTLAGLAAYAAFGWTWLDPAAGFVIAAVALWEGKEAWEGELPEDDDGAGSP